jgi:putative membrane protein insertion efficiency factor
MPGSVDLELEAPVTDRQTFSLRGFLTGVLIAPIRFYQLVFRPMLPSGICRFTPSCSEYALEALHTHGPGRGLWLTTRRLLRCHPFTWLGGSSGFDPVPPPK